MGSADTVLEHLRAGLRSDIGLRWLRTVDDPGTRRTPPSLDPSPFGSLNSARDGGQRLSENTGYDQLEILITNLAVTLAEARADCRERARRSFNLVVILGSMAFAWTLTATVLASFSLAPSAVVAAGGSVLSGSLSAVFFRMYIHEGRRLDQLLSDLGATEQVRLEHLLYRSRIDPASETHTVMRLDPASEGE